MKSEYWVFRIRRKALRKPREEEDYKYIYYGTGKRLRNYWLNDEEFWAYYRVICGRNQLSWCNRPESADRKRWSWRMG